MKLANERRLSPFLIAAVVNIWDQNEKRYQNTDATNHASMWLSLQYLGSNMLSSRGMALVVSVQLGTANSCGLWVDCKICQLNHR